MRIPLLGRLKSPVAAASLAATVFVPFTPAPTVHTLYVPRTMKAAYAHGTRSLDGKPGPRYWQNRARYAMTMTVAPPNRTITGAEDITYLNDSPDTLHHLIIKLFINIHKPGAPRAGGASDQYLTPGVEIDSFAVNGQPESWRTSPRFFTWQPVQLPSPVAPHDSVRLHFGWHYEISRQAGREGMLDSTTY